MGGKKNYEPSPKFQKHCTECGDTYYTPRANQTHCSHPDCQVARKRHNMERFITKQYEKLRSNNA